MIVQTKTGVLVAGTIGKDPELKHVGQYDRAVLKMTVRYGSEQGEDGKRRGKYLDVDVWSDAEELDGMLVKDDPVIVTAGEIKSREYNGKTYYSVSADGVFPGAGVVFRWMQQIVDMIPPAAAPAPADFTTIDAAPPAQFPDEPEPQPDDASYQGEQLSTYSPEVRAAAQSPAPAAAPAAEMEPPIEEAEDLPF